MTSLWLLTAYAHAWANDVLEVHATTDVPCHLWLRWTDREDRTHLRTKTNRGLAKLDQPDYCFVQWNEVEQNEPGDTIQHTFTFGGWHHCLRRWWHLRGQISGADSPSQTCIFTDHYLAHTWVLSLGIFGDLRVLTNAVKLEEGQHISITRDYAHNALLFRVVE